MSNFKQLKTTIYGDLGEQFLKEFAKAKGAKCYQPTLNESNPVDSIMYKNNKLFSVEVKTKGRMKWYPTTGMDRNDHNTYVNFCIPVCILFVDYKSGSMYYQWINKLDKIKTEMKNDTRCYYYPLSAMKKYRDLTKEEIETLSKHCQSNYK